MSNPDEIQVIFCTVPDTTTGERIARYLLEQRLAACVNLIAGIRSFYRWQGQIESGEEVLLKIKAARADYARLETAIRSQHPYELPEIIAVSVSNGFTEYLDWVLAQRNEAI
jgi:periplasmic divalent cation tolerance protein